MPKRSRVLWWAFGALASIAAASTVVLFWLFRGGRNWTVIDGQKPPSTPDSAPDGPSDSGSTGQECSCADSCGSAGSNMCDDVLNDACEQPMDGLCSSSTDCGSNVDCGSVNCNTTVAGSQLAQLLSSGQPWFSDARPQPRDRITLPARLGIAVIRGYQRHVSARLGTRCRFTPTCSEYGAEALTRYGALDGAMLTVTRIRRCTAVVAFGTLDPA